MSAKESLGLGIDVNLPVHMWTGEQILSLLNLWPSSEDWWQRGIKTHIKRKKNLGSISSREKRGNSSKILSSERFVVATVWWSPTSVTRYPQLDGHKADLRRKSWQQWLILTAYDVILKATQPQISVIKSLMSLLIWQGLLNKMRHVRPLKEP